jgi:hypothetical protein
MRLTIRDVKYIVTKLMSIVSCCDSEDVFVGCCWMTVNALVCESGYLGCPVGRIDGGGISTPSQCIQLNRFGL